MLGSAVPPCWTMTFGGGQLVADEGAGVPLVRVAEAALDALEVPAWPVEFEASQGAIDAFFLRHRFLAGDTFEG